MNKEQPDLFPRAEKPADAKALADKPEDEMTEEPEVPPEEDARIQKEKRKRENLKKQIPEDLAKLGAKLGVQKGPLFENTERQN